MDCFRCIRVLYVVFHMVYIQTTLHYTSLLHSMVHYHGYTHDHITWGPPFLRALRDAVWKSFQCLKQWLCTHIWHAVLTMQSDVMTYMYVSIQRSYLHYMCRSISTLLTMTTLPVSTVHARVYACQKYNTYGLIITSNGTVVSVLSVHCLLWRVSRDNASVFRPHWSLQHGEWVTCSWACHCMWLHSSHSVSPHDVTVSS